MSLFHLDWFVCRDGYRLEERRSPLRTRRSGGSRLVIVPNSNAWVPSKPLDSPGLYRELGACDLGGPEELLRFIEYNGLLFRAKAPKEELANVIEYISGMRPSMVRTVHPQTGRDRTLKPAGSTIAPRLRPGTLIGMGK